MSSIYRINTRDQDPDQIGLPKISVPTAVVTINGLLGDYNHNAKEKGIRQQRAISLFPFEDLEELSEAWSESVGVDTSINPGHLGENITTLGIPYSQFQIGQRYRLGAALIQITGQITPCQKLGRLPYVTEDLATLFMRLLDGKRGLYASVIEEGTISVDDPIELI